MTPADDLIDIFLHPGDLYFGDAGTRLRTILGSCVAITMWHPARRIGGMTHCLLPAGDTKRAAREWDGKYVEDALLMLLDEAGRAGTRAHEYQFKLFGGSDMFAKAESSTKETIGRQNALCAIRMLDERGLTIVTHDVGGTVSRSLIFELATGDAWVRKGTRRPTLPLPVEFAK